MALNKLVGGVRMLGNAKTNNHGASYSLVEMKDGRIVKNMWVDSDLDNFLRRTLDASSDATLWLQGNKLRALTTDGKTYVSTSGYQNPILSYIFLAIGIPLCALLIGFLIVWANINNLKTAFAINEVFQMHPDAIRL